MQELTGKRPERDFLLHDIAKKIALESSSGWARLRKVVHHSGERKHFSEDELANLTLAVIAINGWNQLAISFRAVPGTYQPPTAKNHDKELQLQS